MKLKGIFNKSKKEINALVESDPLGVLLLAKENEFEDKIKDLDEDGKRTVSKLLHKEDLVAFNKKENALCFIVIGSITLVTAILFIFLSFKKKMNKIIGIDTQSLQFILMIIFFVLAAFLLIVGFIRFFSALKLRKQCKGRIIKVSKKN